MRRPTSSWRTTAASSSPTATPTTPTTAWSSSTAEGNFLKEWGTTGYAPGEFRTLHGIAIDNDGRLFIADRSNNRVQIFDQEGNFLAQWTQFGRPSGITFDAHGRVYVADSESDDVQNPGWETRHPYRRREDRLGRRVHPVRLGATRARSPATGRSSWRWTPRATSTAASRGRGTCRSTCG